MKLSRLFFLFIVLLSWVSCAENISRSVPYWNEGYPALQSVTSVSFGVAVNVDRDAVVYFAVLPDGSAVPSSTNIRAGMVVSALTQGSLSVEANIPAVLRVTNLLLNSRAQVYLLADAVSGMMSSDMEMVDAWVAPAADYGDGSDGDILLLAGNTVGITNLYEQDTCPGAVTWRGTNKGLNHGAGTYSPMEGRYIMARSIYIQTGAVLTAAAWGNGSDNRRGIVWIACTGGFTNFGRVDLDGMGGSGGAGFSHSGSGNGGGNDGQGEGAGDGGYWMSNGIGGTNYGTPLIPALPWRNLYGSGGASGGYYGNSIVGAGGSGGGAVRIYAKLIDTAYGAISADGMPGEQGWYAGTGFDSAGAGGGGSGGTVYLSAVEHALIGTGQLTCSGGIGHDKYAVVHGGGLSQSVNGGGGGHAVPGTAGGSHTAGTGGDGSPGRIHIDGPYTGSTSC